MKMPDSVPNHNSLSLTRRISRTKTDVLSSLWLSTSLYSCEAMSNCLIPWPGVPINIDPSLSAIIFSIQFDAEGAEWAKTLNRLKICIASLYLSKYPSALENHIVPSGDSHIEVA